jgi:hypothetical protein
MMRIGEVHRIGVERNGPENDQPYLGSEIYIPGFIQDNYGVKASSNWPIPKSQSYLTGTVPGKLILARRVDRPFLTSKSASESFGYDKTPQP